MIWNWQQPDWPEVRYDAAALEALEKRFLLHSGEFIGAYKHVGQDDRDMLKIELISDEALKTAEIEGEILDRGNVQSSLRQQFYHLNIPGVIRPENGAESRSPSGTTASR